jgi:hypothetical protein
LRIRHDYFGGPWTGGVEALTNALANPNVEERFWVAATLGWNGRLPNFLTLAKRGGGPWAWPEPVLQAIIPALARCLKDRELNVRVFSAQALGDIGQDAAAAVPALAGYLAAETNADNQVTGLEALAKFGTAAKPASAEITRFLGNSNLQVRMWATNALIKINPEAAARAAAQAGLKYYASLCLGRKMDGVMYGRMIAAFSSRPPDAVIKGFQSSHPCVRMKP